MKKNLNERVLLVLVKSLRTNEVIIEEHPITKVGKKYYHVKDMQFDKETGVQISDYTAEYKIYENEGWLMSEIFKQRLLERIPSMLKLLTSTQLMELDEKFFNASLQQSILNDVKFNREK